MTSPGVVSRHPRKVSAPRLASVLIALVCFAPIASAQPTEALDRETAARVGLELRELERWNGYARQMLQYNSLSLCEVDSIRSSLSALPREESSQRARELRQETRQNLSGSERYLVRQNTDDILEANAARFRALVETHGWPDSSRLGTADAGAAAPLLLSLSLDDLDHLNPILRDAIERGRLPAQTYASAYDRALRLDRKGQLYGTLSIFDSRSNTTRPPRIEDVERTNRARADIGLPPLEAYETGPPLLGTPRPSPAARSPEDPISEPVRELIGFSLDMMAELDQQVGLMSRLHTLSPCEIEETRRSLGDLEPEEREARLRALSAEHRDRLSEHEQALLQIQLEAIGAIHASRLLRLVSRYGWPGADRFGDVATSEPLSLLLSAPTDTLDASLPTLRREVEASRMTPEHYAQAADHLRIRQGRAQLYGTVREFDPEAEAFRPPTIASLDEANAARASLGLPPLNDYRLAGRQNE
ncbi:MAG: DUF6624 domain-containing protein [Bacteroidota bacterium]